VARFVNLFFYNAEKPLSILNAAKFSKFSYPDSKSKLNE
jgi:hypothetical protein